MPARMNELTNRRREEKDRRRNEILDAAAAAAADGGFDAITMDHVARRARLSRALLYVYFEDKTALYVALCERALELLNERFVSATQGAANGRDRLAIMGRAYVAVAREEPVYFEVLAHSDARNTHDLEENMPRCLELGDRCHNLITGAIRDGMADGSIRSDVGLPDAVGVVLWGFMHGVIQIAVTKAGLLEHRNTNAEQLYDQALALVLHGLGPAA